MPMSKMCWRYVLLCSADDAAEMMMMMIILMMNVVSMSLSLSVHVVPVEVTGTVTLALTLSVTVIVMVGIHKNSWTMMDGTVSAVVMLIPLLACRTVALILTLFVLVNSSHFDMILWHLAVVM